MRPSPPYKPRSQFPVLGSVPFHIRIEQQQIAASHFQPPHFRPYGAMARLDLHRHRDAVRSDGRLHGQLGDVPFEVILLLPAVLVQPLAEVALAVKQTDSDQGNTEVGSALDVVARQDTESAGVNRDRLMQPEFRREIGDRPGPQNTSVRRAPGPVRL